MKPGATARPRGIDHSFRGRAFEIANSDNAIAANCQIGGVALRRLFRRKQFRS